MISLKKGMKLRAIYLPSITMIMILMFVGVPNEALAETPRGPDEPYIHGYNAEEVKGWSPEDDPYAAYFRSHVPLAERIDSFQETQANPNLTDKAKVLNLSADYDKEEWFANYRHHDSFSRNTLNFWQYQDIYANWHGLPVEDSPKEEEDLKHGVINIPNPAYTDAAHKNGVKSLGGWFWPRDIEFAELVEKTDDGRFPMAEKMIEMADYFGYDGYFINQEETISSEHAELLMEMLKYLREEGVYISWYDSLSVDGDITYQNAFNEENSPWVYDKTDDRRASDSIFMNYAYTPEGLEDSADHARELGLDPFEAVYAGIENDKFNFDRGLELDAIFKDDKARTPRTSLALFGTDMVWNKGPNSFDNDMQKYSEERERAYWSGPNQDPTQTGRDTDSEFESWQGVAHYIPARSVIGTYPFVTHFNNGHGLGFYLDGEKSSDQEWSDMGVQDILPTWQWWVETNGNGDPLSVSYDYENVWNGGSSIKVEGDINQDNPTDIHLYKTELPVSDETELSITHLIDQDDKKENVTVEAMLTFKDDPDHPEHIKLDMDAKEDWTTSKLDLSSYEGKTIASIGLTIKSDSEKATDFKANIGELSLTNGDAEKVDEPTGFKVDNAYYEEDKASFFLSWDFDADETNVQYYDIYQKHDGKRAFIGRVYDGVYYAKEVDVKDKDKTTLELVAIGKDGSESAPAEVEWNYGDGEETEYQEGPFPAEGVDFSLNLGEDNKNEELNMEVGWEHYLNVRVRPSYATNVGLEWESSDESVAIVNQRGKVISKGVGEATITAKTEEVDGLPTKKLEIPVTVNEPEIMDTGVTLQAEEYDESNGLFNPYSYVNVRDLNFANWMSFSDVDFGDEEMNRLTVRAAPMTGETTMELRLDDADGPVIAEIELPMEDEESTPNYETYEAALDQPVTGTQTIHITFKNPNYESWDIRDNGIVDVDWINFGNISTDLMLQSLDHYQSELSDEVFKAMQTHLTSVSHFEEQEKGKKVIKHMKGFKDLLNNYEEDGELTEPIYNALIDQADAVIGQWK